MHPEGFETAQTSEGTQTRGDIAMQDPGLRLARELGCRALTWEDAVREIGEAPSAPRRSVSAAEAARASVGFVHHVPPPLREVGCMWLEEGDESRRCGRQVAWMMGLSFHLSRFYCEDHGNVIYNGTRRQWERRRRRQQRRKGQEEAVYAA